MIKLCGLWLNKSKDGVNAVMWAPVAHISAGMYT